MGDTSYNNNPYSLFDPSQWSNPFSTYSKQALPWPSSYAGYPTDAMGNPIQPAPGMTLNSAPIAQAAAAAQPQQPQLTPYLQQGDGRDSGGRGAQLATPEGSLAGYLDQYGDRLPIAAGQRPQGMDDQTFRQMIGPLAASRMGMTNQGAAQPAASPGGGGLAAQSYLQLLANPGKVTTPGATVPQGALPTGGSSAIQSWLNSYSPQASGPGSGFTNSFYKTLRGS